MKCVKLTVLLKSSAACQDSRTIYQISIRAVIGQHPLPNLLDMTVQRRLLPHEKRANRRPPIVQDARLKSHPPPKRWLQKTRCPTGSGQRVLEVNEV